jgi:cell division protein FtsQ
MTGGLRAGREAGGRAPRSERAAGGSPVKRGRDPWRAAFFGALTLAILGVGAWALLGSSLLAVRHEEVTGNGTIPAAEVLAAAAIRPGTPLASVDTAAAARRVEQIDQVLSATVSRAWPDTIVISVRERTAVLAVAGRREFALIDPSGVTVRWSQRRPPGMPLLEAVRGQLRGSRDVLAAATVWRELPARLRGMVASIAAPSPQEVTLHLRGGITVVWGAIGGAQAKAGEVLALLRTGARYYDVSDPDTAVTQG